KHAALVIPAAAAGLAALHEASADAGDAAPPSGLRYFLETLTPLHFFRLSTLLASTALDRGRSALIVCPAAVKPEVIARFQAARGIGERSAGEQWVELNTQNPDRNVPIDVIVAAPEEIETLLVRSQDYREDLRRLGAIFVLNLDRTDPGLLGINLRRLRNASSHPNDLVYIAQSEPLIDQENRIQQSLPRTSAARIRSDLELAGKTNRYISIWLPEAEDSIDDPAHWPVEIQAILAAKEVDPAVEPFLWDMRRSYLSNHWHTVLPPLLREQNREALVPVVRDLAPERLGPRPGKNTVAVVAGHGNLADALSLSFANGEADDALCVIAMMDYPLARFHFDRFRTSVVNAQRSDISSREALRLFRNAYAAMSPKPNTGPVELALMLANEFLVANQAALSDPNRGWLSQSAIEEFWQGEPAEALRQLRINTTKTGLVRLFRLCVGHTIRIEQQRAANLVRRYRLQNPRQIEGATVSRLAIRTPSLELGSIPEADHGLSYAKDTTIIVGAALYHVSDVDSAKQCLWVMEADGNEPRFAFVRSYAIVRAWRRGDPADADETHDIAVDAYFQERNKRVPFELANGYIRVARRTSLAYRYAGPVTPFLGEERGPQSLPCHVPQPARLRSAALLRLFHDGAGTRPPRRTGADRGANRQEACVAFTLATTLQDTLASLFPAHAHRIAVVSPQAAGIETDLDANGRGLDPRTRFALDRQPVLAELDPQRLAVDPEDAKRRCRLSADATRAYERYVGQFFDQARDISQVPVAPGATRMFSFIVIEDSDHDLGIARVFVERREHVFRIWEEFLDHCVRTATSPDDNPYDFHSGKVSEAFRFQPALDVVRNMRRN
ncbi:MAG: hypothetical protein KDC18_04970, partial [Alphaproteobacteria bacterium]|nr:hypothetical protein [Alphaproteobacteria bacterium]